MAIKSFVTFAVLTSVYGLTINKRYDSGGFPTGNTDPNSGLSSSCDAFYYVKPDDSCWAIVNSYGNFTLNQAVKSDCHGLQPDYYVCIGVTGSTTVASQTTLPATTVGTRCSNLEAGYWVCVGMSGGTSATTTTPTSTSTSTASSTTPTSSAPSPTQSGLVDDCSTYYQAKSGDSCWSIFNNKYTYLTTSLFEEWNPAFGLDCSNLQPGYYYCVATQKQAPMPDMINTCNKWHLVADGDNCWSIEQDAGITAGQFNTWNPYVGSSCANLWLGYWVCVGI
ncbi:carbohydrate-binding module family 50 protein [Aspergillus luchuensis CBS 106.47]|uniref:Carbohydrate-binding module family 50 protein n=1 Tax=Aspergillus luchuensis (strain CBS 106.47) TaxID=1137211 RepID=A0A1M3TVY0_ASPLC|nr:carbohydrate-binding module family 50 protein [Aspergillus luchuensis CBS 106.47]